MSVTTPIFWKLKECPTIIVKPLYEEGGKITRVQAIWSNRIADGYPEYRVYPYVADNFEKLTDSEVKELYAERRKAGLRPI